LCRQGHRRHAHTLAGFHALPRGWPHLLDGRLGKASGKRVPADRAEEVERLYRGRYQDFTVKHFHEHLIKDHGFGWGYTWLKLHLQWAGVVAKAPRKGRIGGSASGDPCRCASLISGPAAAMSQRPTATTTNRSIPIAPRT
jgi:hypothetical protein